MFLVKDKLYGTTYLVFTYENPRKDGFAGQVDEDVELDYDMEAVHRWPEGGRRPGVPRVGQAPENRKRYKVFRSADERSAEHYIAVDGAPVVFGSWSDYVGLHLNPPDPLQLKEEDWHEYLDKVDEFSRRSREREQAPEAPVGGNRDDVAEWVARKHFIVDRGIREIWYLPKESPLDEIRLLELNEQVPFSGSQVEATDFGLDVEGASFRLMVADVNGDQLQQVKTDPSRLPPGWSLDDKRIWRRRGA